MLPWFRKSLSRKAEEKTLPVSPGNTQEKALFIRDSDGFYLPQSADILLATPQRQNWLQQISRVVALPDNQYRALCLSPLQTLAERLQCVPASKTGKYAGEGGLLDLTLNTTAWCMRMSQKEMLPRGLPSEEQSRQFSAWNVCVFYTGLFYWLPLTAQLEGQLNSLSLWQPGISPPSEPYRFRFHEPVPDITHFRRTTGAMMAFRLLPEKVIHWLSGTPKALQALSDMVTGQVNGDNDLQCVLNEALAAFPAGALPALSSVVSVSAPDASSSVLSGQPENDIASSVPAELAQKPQPAPLPVTSVLPPESVTSEKTENGIHCDIPPMADAEAEGVVAPETPDSADEKTVSDTYLPLSEDMKYALELSGLMPDVLSDTQTGNSDDKDEQFKNCLSTKNEGEAFWAWFESGLLGGKMAINTPDAKVHCVMEYLFCQSPAIFYQYIQETGKNPDDIGHIISSFESLKLHRIIRRDTRQSGHFRARIYSEKLDPLSDNKTLITLSHKKINGYMIKGSRIFGMNMPEESLFIRIVGS
ncbi:TraI domain-containing protein [Morganella morganii subsp. morganii]|uniref:TraI domain-containing protein n=1 Tax=Morganella morganii TaxID=582 RepID=UPI001BD96C13|nr:TraI domain-containing protein [Morganella morganii]MBT0351078.1 TraI domain-containing protein [Morganella morganii subsp. morganii]